MRTIVRVHIRRHVWRMIWYARTRTHAHTQWYIRACFIYPGGYITYHAHTHPYTYLRLCYQTLASVVSTRGVMTHRLILCVCVRTRICPKTHTCDYSKGCSVVPTAVAHTKLLALAHALPPAGFLVYAYTRFPRTYDTQRHY